MVRKLLFFPLNYENVKFCLAVVPPLICTFKPSSPRSVCHTQASPRTCEGHSGAGLQVLLKAPQIPQYIRMWELLQGILNMYV